ncbi:MAG: fused MFS/spermidine synthase [Armatimonadota bacterium]
MDESKKLPYFGMEKLISLWVLVFFAGWFVMQTELVGARALAPYFGNSIYVWGSVLAVFLVTLAIGYGIGGFLTRRFQSHWIPAILLIIAGAMVILSVTYQDSLCAWFVAKGFDVRWGSLAATAILYALPMVLAGTISPYAIHLAAGARSETGSKAGTLYSVSTVGSFVGSLITSFILIPSFSLGAVAISGGLIVAVAGIVTAIALSTANRASVALSIIFTGAVIALSWISPAKLVPISQKIYQKSMVGEVLCKDNSTAKSRLAEAQRQALTKLSKVGTASDTKLLFRTETAYHRIEVTQEGPVRMLTFGSHEFKYPQTAINLRNISTHISEYTGVMLAPVLYKPHPKRILMIGLGGADIARSVENCYPDAKLDVVEIDPAVVSIAQKYFFWRPGKNVTVYTMDGRTFINFRLLTKSEPYDWAIVDAYDSDYTPFHLNTLGFYRHLAVVMTPDGVVSVNSTIISELYSYQARTMNAAFGTVDAYMCHRSGNAILVSQIGAKKNMTLDRATKAQKRLKFTSDQGIDPQYITSCLVLKRNWESKGEILTDMWAPVERLMSMQ